MPNAFTNAAAVRPPVSASAATPASMAVAVTALCAEKPRRKPCSSSHSLAKPLNGGRAQIDRAPIPNSAAVAGRRRSQPAEAVQVAGAGRVLDRPGGQEQAALERRVVDQLEQRRDQGEPGEHAGAR